MPKELYNGRSLEVYKANSFNTIFFISLNPNIPREKSELEHLKNNPCKLLEKFKISLAINEYGKKTEEGSSTIVRCNLDYGEWVFLAAQVKRAVYFGQFVPFDAYKCHNMQTDSEGKSRTFRCNISYHPENNGKGRKPFAIYLTEGKATVVRKDTGFAKPTNDVPQKKAGFYLNEMEFMDAVAKVERFIDMYLRSFDEQFKQGLQGYLDAVLKGRQEGTYLQSVEEQNEVSFTEEQTAETSNAQQQVSVVQAILQGEFSDTVEGHICCCFFKNGNSAWLIFPHVTEGLRQSRETNTPVTLDIIGKNGKYFAREHSA